MLFGSLFITQLLVTSTTVSFLSGSFVISEIFCGSDPQFNVLGLYSHKYTYERTFVEHPIPAGTDKCLIRIFDNINYLIKYIDIDSSFK